MEVIRTNQSETSFREFFDTLKRQRWVLIGTMGIAMGLGFASTKLIEPTYQSSTVMIVAGRTNAPNQPSANADPLRSLTGQSLEDISTQLEQIQSANLIGDVLTEVLQANPSLQPKTAGDPQVSARQVGLTTVIEVTVTSSVPELAQKVADAVPISFRSAVKKKNGDELDRGISYLDSQKTTEEAKLKQAQQRLQLFRTSKGLSPSPTEGSDRAGAKLRAEQDYNMAVGEYEAALKELAVLQSTRKGLPELVPTPVIENNLQNRDVLNQQIAQLKGERDSLLETFQPEAPEVKSIEARLRNLELVLKDLPLTVNNQRKVRNPDISFYDNSIAKSNADLAAAQARMLSRQSFLEEASRRVQDFNSLKKDLEKMLLDIDTGIAKVQNLDGRLTELNLLRNAVKDPVTVISAAKPPKQNKPNPPLYMGISVVFGLLGAVAIIVVKDRLEDRVTTIDQACRIANVPTLGYVPPRAFAKSRNRAKGKRMLALPARTLENYRIVRSNVLFSGRDEPFQSMMVTSTGPAEGKSEVATNLAISMAGAGKRVLLIDANLHRPDLHNRFGFSQSPGLSDLLLGTAEIEEAAHSTDFQNLSVITAGTGSTSIGDGLGSEEMRRLYQRLVSAYDLVVFDTPPMLPRSDALTLSSVVDTVVYVVKPGGTTKTLMRYCIELLQHAHARLLGVVFTNTDFYAEDAA